MLVALIGSLTWLGACSEEYAAPALSAQVVDADTGLPLAGVAVASDWQLEGGLEGGNLLGAITVMEAETDDKGKFQFPGWGPKQVERSLGVYANARLRSRAPGLTLFKAGYEYKELQNYGSPSANTHDIVSDWNGRTIKLKPFRGTSAEYARQLDWLSSSLLTYTASDRRCAAGKPCPAACQGQGILKTISAIGDESRKLQENGIQSTTIDQQLIANEDAYRRLGCMSTRTLLGAKKK
jgi:hypothetical protein